MARPRVLIIDDSAVVRTTLARELEKRGLEIAGVAADPYVGRDLIVARKPDVVTLDLEMPRMDGLSFLERLMAHYPLPVAVLSSLTPLGSENALRALELGALAVFEKPGGGSALPAAEVLGRLAGFLREAAAARPRRRLTPPPHPLPAAGRGQGGEVAGRGSLGTLRRTSDKVVAVGASTGGTQAVTELLSRLPAGHPGVVVVQHMPPVFTRNFAERLDRRCAMRVKEAEDGDSLCDGLALIAPGNFHLALRRSGAHYRVQCLGGPPVHHMRPSVDVLFHSVAASAGPNAVGVILTGMGRDGAEGLLAMRQAGAATLAQDEASCVVFGMPKEAIALGAAAQVLPLESMAPAIEVQIKKMRSETR
jgi:two-component system chemotaxis response regulator CheB